MYSCNSRSGQLTVFFFTVLKSALKIEIMVQISAFYLVNSGVVEKGLKFIKGPTSFPDWGYRGAFLRDPDGNLIELSGALPADQWSDGLREANEKWGS